MSSIDEIVSEYQESWCVPSFDITMWRGKSNEWCVVIPVINEGDRIHQLLSRMDELKISGCADIIIVDGGSSDNSLELDFLHRIGVTALLVKTGKGKLSAQLRCAYAFCLLNGYKGIVTIDGNNKDDPSAIPKFIEALSQGVDFVQASRFIAGGVAGNTPKLRDFAIRYIHAPLLSLTSGFKWTDTTQGFRGYSRRLLLDERVAPFRDVFSSYELLAYLSYIAPRLNFHCVEIPTTRIYPEGEIPTKISSLQGNLSVLYILVSACLGCYNIK